MSNLNQLFVNNISEGNNSSPDAAHRYVLERLSEILSPRTKVKEVTVSKVANIIKFSFSADLLGLKIAGEASWSEMTLLASDEPVTYFIEKVVTEALRKAGFVSVPQEGNSLS